MKENELRIGNLVERDGNILEVIRIAKDGIINYNLVKKSQGMRVNNGNVIPISLTKEWLLRFGFSEKLGNWELPNFRFHLNKPMNFDGFIFCEGYSVITDKIQFVHQLQNLYFALTNTELICETK